MSEIVAVEAGEPCFRCGNSVDKQEQDPIVFHCGECKRDHLWHGECLPETLREIIDGLSTR